MSEIDEVYLKDLLEWVQQNAHEEGIGEFLAAVADNHGRTLYQIAEDDPGAGLQLCEALFEMVEQLRDDGDDVREYFVRTQPKPERDSRMVLP